MSTVTCAHARARKLEQHHRTYTPTQHILSHSASLTGYMGRWRRGSKSSLSWHRVVDAEQIWIKQHLQINVIVCFILNARLTGGGGPAAAERQVWQSQVFPLQMLQVGQFTPLLLLLPSKITWRRFNTYTDSIMTSTDIQLLSVVELTQIFPVCASWHFNHQWHHLLMSSFVFAS